jgi:hypothetical protein
MTPFTQMTLMIQVLIRMYFDPFGFWDRDGFLTNAGNVR